MEPSPGRCKDHQFQESEQIRSLVFLWVCKRASQSTVVFSASGIVELYPSITSRKIGGLEALLFLANTASRRILWWTWIRCFFLLFTSSLVWWRISWRRWHKNGAAFQHLSTVFPGLSAAKLKEGIFVRPQIQEVLKDTDFEELLNLKELRAWEAFKSVCSGFLGNTCIPDYQACIGKLLKSYEDMGVPNVTQDSFSPFPPQLHPAKPWSSEWWAWRKIPLRHYEDGEQLSRQMEPQHDGMIFCWMILPDILEAKYTRSSKKTHFWLSVVLWIV